METKPIIRRRRVKHALTFEERLLNAASKARELAFTLPSGKERDKLLRSARESETAAQINRSIASPNEACQPDLPRSPSPVHRSQNVQK